MNKFFLLAILLLSFVPAFAQHEYSPLQEHELKYKDWTYKNVADGKDVNLRSFLKGKKLVMVVYFAPWCPNWRNEAPFAEKLYQKYKNNGFDVIGVSEYAAIEDTKVNLSGNGTSYTVVSESDSREMKEKTPHYDYRKETGDTRNWGSPWNIFLEPDKVKKDGDVLVRSAFVVNGELVEAEVEAFIRQKLGLPAEEKKAETAQTKAPEVCAEDPKLTPLKKP
jgi:thiol-disulfide isomerase/thioredoxin